MKRVLVLSVIFVTFVTIASAGSKDTQSSEASEKEAKEEAFTIRRVNANKEDYAKRSNEDPETSSANAETQKSQEIIQKSKGAVVKHIEAVEDDIRNVKKDFLKIESDLLTDYQAVDEAALADQTKQLSDAAEAAAKEKGTKTVGRRLLGGSGGACEDTEQYNKCVSNGDEGNSKVAVTQEQDLVEYAKGPILLQGEMTKAQEIIKNSKETVIRHIGAVEKDLHNIKVDFLVIEKDLMNDYTAIESNLNEEAWEETGASKRLLLGQAKSAQVIEKSKETITHHIQAFRNDIEDVKNDFLKIEKDLMSDYKAVEANLIEEIWEEAGAVGLKPDNQRKGPITTKASVPVIQASSTITHPADPVAASRKLLGAGEEVNIKAEEEREVKIKAQEQEREVKIKAQEQKKDACCPKMKGSILLQKGKGKQIIEDSEEAIVKHIQNFQGDVEKITNDFLKIEADLMKDDMAVENVVSTNA